MPKLKLQYFGHWMWTTDSLGKSLMLGKRKRGNKEKRVYMFLRRQVRWYSLLFKRRSSSVFKNFPQFVVIHTVKGFSVVNEAEVDVFLEFLCFLCDPTNAGNLISGSSAFSKLSSYIWKFSFKILLKPSLKDFEHNLKGCKLCFNGWYNQSLLIILHFWNVLCLLSQLTSENLYLFLQKKAQWCFITIALAL